MADNIITNAIEFWNKTYQVKEAKIKFIKKDGTERVMRFTLDFSRIPKEKHPKSINMAKIVKLMQQNGIIHVFDLDKSDWRSVPFNNIEWVDINNKRYKIIPALK